MRGIWLRVGLAFLLGAILGVVYVLASRSGRKLAPGPFVSGPPKPTALKEEVVRERVMPLLPEGMTLVRVNPISFREFADGSFGAGYLLRLESSISWFQLPVGHFSSPAGADALQRKLASYLVFYPDLEPGSCYRVNRRRAVARKGKAITVKWAVERALFSDNRWSVEKTEPLPFESWGRVFTEEEVSEVQEAERAAWEGMVRTLQRIRDRKVSLATGQRAFGTPQSPDSRTGVSLPSQQQDFSGERVEKALPVESPPAGERSSAVPEPTGPPGPSGNVGAEPSADPKRLYKEYERQLQRAATKQRARLAEEKKNSSVGGATKSTVAP
ncbi:hypothetical protein [Verrucomicrobium sp. 3C]|uniref:hypothetical protein n=1 Tax=Verrucomicrobium sp. 3C TaxID=1134055 RepID=UPI0003678180|nr:hypothetical protein [Verrucomicrobium sp. 3C]